MDFANAQEVREALAQFEGKRVLEVDFDVPNSVRITRSPPNGRRNKNLTPRCKGWRGGVRGDWWKDSREIAAKADLAELLRCQADEG